MQSPFRSNKRLTNGFGSNAVTLQPLGTRTLPTGPPPPLHPPLGGAGWPDTPKYMPKEGEAPPLSPVRRNSSERPRSETVGVKSNKAGAGRIRQTENLLFQPSADFTNQVQSTFNLDPTQQTALAFQTYSHSTPAGVLANQLQGMSVDFGGSEPFWRAFGVNPNSPREVSGFLTERFGEAMKELGDPVQAVQRVLADMRWEAGLLAPPQTTPEENIFGAGDWQALLQSLIPAPAATPTPGSEAFQPAIDPRFLTQPFGF